MNTLSHICRWLSSGFVAMVVSCVAFAVISIAYEGSGLRRLGVDDDVCWLGFAIGPALIVLIHRVFHHRAWIPMATLVGGLVLAGLGLCWFKAAHGAAARHVSSGPLSGIEHLFGMLLGAALAAVAMLAVMGGALALVARWLHPPHSFESPVKERQ